MSHLLLVDGVTVIKEKCLHDINTIFEKLVFHLNIEKQTRQKKEQLIRFLYIGNTEIFNSLY